MSEKINEELLESLEDVVSVIKFWQSKGVPICACTVGYECRFCKARTLSEKYRKMFVKRGGRVKCLTTGEVFDNARRASEFYKISEASIGKCCKGTASYVGTFEGRKLVWRYE